MKKSLIFVAAAALVLASCNNDVKLDENVALADSNVQKEISVTPYAHGPKRAAADTYQYAIDGTDFPEDLNMYVAAYQVAPIPKGDYFTGTQFVYGNAAGAAASSGYWGGATPRYWPLAPSYINFLAYANVTGTAKFGDELASPVAAASTAVISQTDNSSAQTDLMYAIGNGEVTQSGNTLIFPDKVAMEFHHAQAWIDFYVKGTTAIKIKSITLTGAYYSGTYTITHTNFDQNSSQSVAGVWTDPDDQQAVTVPGIAVAGQDLTGSYVQAGKGLLVVPNGFTSFTINYDYDSKNYNYTYTPASTTLAEGKHYIYNINFTLHEIFVEASVEDWGDVNTYVEVPATTIAYNEETPGAFPAAAAGIYQFTITGVPAHGESSYSVVAADDGADIITSVTKKSDTTPASGDTKGIIEVEVNLKAATGTKNVLLKLGGTTKMTIAVTRS